MNSARDNGSLIELLARKAEEVAAVPVNAIAQLVEDMKDQHFWEEQDQGRGW